MKENPYKMDHIPSKQERFELDDQAKLFPKMVVINSAYPCNAFCPHCPYTLSNSKIRLEPRAKETPFIPWDVFKAIADEVGQYKAILRVSGAGEPLFHKDIVDYIEYAEKVGCEVGIITNGSLMTEDKARRLLASGIEMIEFSVDAADPETYDIVRKGLKFEETLENVKRTVAIRDEMKAKTGIIASVVNQKIVEDKLDSIVEYWDAIVDTVQVRKYLTWDINDLSESANLTPYLDAEAPCPFPFDRLLIDTNGEIRFCVYDIKAKTNAPCLRSSKNRW